MAQQYSPGNIQPGYPGNRPAYGPNAAKPMSRSGRRKMNRNTRGGKAR